VSIQYQGNHESQRKLKQREEDVTYIYRETRAKELGSILKFFFV